MKHFAAILFLLFFCHTLAEAQHWTGATDADWNDPSNWSDWPLNGEDITIDPALYGGQPSPVITANSIFSPAEIAIVNGGVLTIQADLSTLDDVEVVDPNSQIQLHGGTFAVNHPGEGRLIVEFGSSMTVTAGELRVGERFIIGEEAQVFMTGGSVQSGERFLIEGGGRFFQNGGSAMVNGVFGIGDGFEEQSSEYHLNQGSLHVIGEMSMENEAGDFQPLFIQSAGELDLEGDLVYFGETPGSGRPQTIFNGGTATITGEILHGPGSTIHLYIRSGGEAQINLEGPGLTIQPMDSILLGGNSTWRFQSDCSWDNAGTIRAEDQSQILVFGSVETTNDGEFQLNDLGVESGATFTHAASQPLLIAGDLQHDGTLTAEEEPVIFNGDSPQILSGTTPMDWYTLHIDNSAGVEASSPMDIADHLELVAGRLITWASAPVRLLQDATCSEGSETAFVSGPLYKLGDESFLFPIGKNDRYAPLEMSAPEQITDEFMAEYFDEPHAQAGPWSSPLQGISQVEYWTLVRAQGESSVSPTLFWQDASDSDLSDCEIMLARLNGDEWVAIPSSVSGDCEGSESGSVEADEELADLGAFTIGFLNPTHTRDLTNRHEVRVGPNPFGEAFEIFLPENVAWATVELYTATGRKVFDRTYTPKLTTIRVRPPLPAGLYVAQITTPGTTRAVKIRKE